MKKSVAVVALALFSTFALAGVALAAESDDSAESAIVTPQVIVDEENGVVLIGLPIDGELPECSIEEPTEPGDGTSGDADEGEEGEEGDDDTYSPGDCIEIVIEHPSGKTHHGAIVSSVAKTLHPSMLDGIKKGEIMRYVAKSGKTDDGEGDDGEGETVDKKDKSEKRDKPANKDKSNRGNKDKADRPNNGKGNRGNRG